MKLFWSSRSPFARKVMVAAHELGMESEIETVRVVVANDVADPTVMAANPLGQIPTLLRDDGSTLFDSRVIVDYLDAMQGGRLLPQAGEPRWTVLRREALGDGLAQLNRGRLAEARRGAMASPDYATAYEAKTTAVLDRLDADPPEGSDVDIGQIAVAVALAHLDFRFPDEGWRAGRPRLAAWFDRFDRRPSMRSTVPEEVY